MKTFYYDTDKRLREIFAEHCNLCGEQYEWIRGEFTCLVADFQESEPQAEIEKRMERMRTVFDFLYETKCLTVGELTEVNELLSEIWETAMQIIAKAALKAGAQP